MLLGNYPILCTPLESLLILMWMNATIFWRGICFFKVLYELYSFFKYLIYYAFFHLMFRYLDAPSNGNLTTNVSSISNSSSLPMIEEDLLTLTVAKNIDDLGACSRDVSFLPLLFFSRLLFISLMMFCLF